MRWQALAIATCAAACTTPTVNDTDPISGELDGSYQFAYTPYVGPTITDQHAEAVFASAGGEDCCLHALVGTDVGIGLGNQLPLQDPTAGACPPVVSAYVTVGADVLALGQHAVALDDSNARISIYYSDALADPCPREIDDPTAAVQLDQQLVPSGQIKVDTTSCLESLACDATASFAIEGLDVAGAAILRESGTFQITWWKTTP